MEKFELLFQTMGIVVIIPIIIILGYRYFWIKQNNKKIIPYKEIMFISFLVYSLCLFYVVTYPDACASWSTSNFIPFKEITRYKIFSRLFIKNVIGNLFMFIPLGFYLSYFFKTKNITFIFLFNLVVSFAIEISQSMIGRVFDIDDIILNVLGGLFGYFIYHIIKLIFTKHYKLFNYATLISIVGIMIYVALVFTILVK